MSGRGAIPEAAGRAVARTGRRALCLACWAIAASLWPLPAGAADESAITPLVRHREAGVDLRIFYTDKGYLLDASVTEALAGATVRFFIGERDVTPSAETTTPLAEVIYLFSGGDAALQCRAKWRLDAVLGPASLPNAALSEQANQLCPEIGFVGTFEDWPGVVDPQAGYRRLLVIEVGDGAAGGAAAQPHLLEWDRLNLSYARQADATALVAELVDFVQPRTTGFLSFVPLTGGDAQTPVKAVFYRDGAALLSVSSERSLLAQLEALAFERLALDRPGRLEALLAGIAVAVLVLCWLLLRGRRRRRAARAADATPIKAVKIGYGGGFDYSLGAGDERAVARVELYRDGRRRLVRLANGERIEVDGVSVGDAAWLEQGAAISIARKKVILT